MLRINFHKNKKMTLKGSSLYILKRELKKVESLSSPQHRATHRAMKFPRHKPKA